MVNEKGVPELLEDIFDYFIRKNDLLEARIKLLEEAVLEAEKGQLCPDMIKKLGGK